MISYIKGELAELSEEGIVVEVGGIGYAIRVPASVLPQLPPLGNRVKIYTYLQVREDGVGLFGFFTRDDLEMFRLLLSVSGIGSKAALSLLSVLTPDELRFAVLSEDVKTLSRVPGLGKKTSQKLIFELKDKFSLEEAFEKQLAHGAEAAAGAAAGDAAGEAVQALVALGYSQSEALRAVREIPNAGELSVEELLRQALRQMAML